MREAHCAWCGEPLGYDLQPGDYADDHSCGNIECEKELRNMALAERDERYLRAEEDDFGRY